MAQGIVRTIIACCYLGVKETLKQETANTRKHEGHELGKSHS